jgi:hypothetical protein
VMLQQDLRRIDRLRVTLRVFHLAHACTSISSVI